MASKALFDMSSFDTNKVILDKEAICKVNLQRYEFQQMDGIFLMDYETGNMAGYRDIKDDEFWVRGHIPGRPLFPGVLMIEASAQLVSYFAMSQRPDKGFLGFGGVDKVKFRGSVSPGSRIVFLGKMMEVRSRKCVGATQGYVDGKLVFEATISGMWL